MKPEVRQLARELAKDSIVTDALAQFIGQIVEEIHASKVAPAIARAERAESELAVIREALELYREAVRIDVKMEGPQFMGANSSALKRAWLHDRAAIANTADRGQEEKGNG